MTRNFHIQKILVLLSLITLFIKSSQAGVGLLYIYRESYKTISNANVIFYATHDTKNSNSKTKYKIEFEFVLQCIISLLC